MTSHYYSKPTRSRGQKLVLVLLVVIVLLIAALLFAWLKPGSGATPGAAAPGSGAAATSAPSTAGASSTASTSASGSTAAPSGAVEWGLPVPGDGGPSNRSGAGVPRGYDASDAGATKAAINAVVAARWMKFRIDTPADTLGELVAGDGGDERSKTLAQLVPASPINIDTGKRETEASPAGGKVLGAHLVSRDATTAKVAVLWESFAAPSKGSMQVTIEPVAVELRWESNDWLIAGFNTFAALDKLASDPAAGTKLSGPIGEVADWVPAPSEGWYW